MYFDSEAFQLFDSHKCPFLIEWPHCSSSLQNMLTLFCNQSEAAMETKHTPLWLSGIIAQLHSPLATAHAWHHAF